MASLTLPGAREHPPEVRDRETLGEGEPSLCTVSIYLGTVRDVQYVRYTTCMHMVGLVGL
jgi:hypothetical protein